MAIDAHVYAGSAYWAAAGPGVRTNGLFRLRPAAGEWEALVDGLPPDPEVRSIVLLPGDPASVIVGTQAGPYRSTDAGETWNALPFPDDEPVVWSLMVHPRNPRVLYAGTENMAVYRSEDRGESWRRLEMPAPPGLCVMDFPTRVVRIALDPVNPDEIYAALEVGGVMRSLDGGRSWSDCNAGLLRLSEREHLKSRIGSDSDTEGMMDSHALAVSPARPGTVFLANRMGLFESPDRGETWEDLGIRRFSELTYARDVKVSPHDDHTLLAALSVAASSDAGSLYRSDDLGRSWSRFDCQVSIDSTLMIIATSASDADRVYCAARRGQVLGTEDGGKTWRTHQLPDRVQGVYALACG